MKNGPNPKGLVVKWEDQTFTLDMFSVSSLLSMSFISRITAGFCTDPENKKKIRRQPRTYIKVFLTVF